MAEESLSEAIEATRRAAKDLADKTALLAQRALRKAEAAGREARVSVKDAAKRARKDLDDAAKEIDKLLHEL